jgi:hypothetical protein
MHCLKLKIKNRELIYPTGRPQCQFFKTLMFDMRDAILQEIHEQVRWAWTLVQILILMRRGEAL